MFFFQKGNGRFFSKKSFHLLFVKSKKVIADLRGVLENKCKFMSLGRLRHYFGVAGYQNSFSMMISDGIAAIHKTFFNGLILSAAFIYIFMTRSFPDYNVKSGAIRMPQVDVGTTML